MSESSVPAGFSPSLAHQSSRLDPRRAHLHLQQAVAPAEWPHDIDGFELINEAGHFLATMHPWKWLEAGEVKLDLRANIAFVGAAITIHMVDTSGDPSSGFVGNNRKLTASTAQFGSYTHLEGDLLEITSGGSNVNKGFYRIAKVVDSSTLQLADSPLADDTLDGTDIKGSIHTSAAALPNDFREIVAIYANNGTNNHVELTTFQDLLEKRSVNATSPGTYYAAVSHAMDVNPDWTNTAYPGMVGPTPRLELWPAPTANELGGLTMFYRAGWAVATDNHHRLKLPGYCETLYLEILRAFARSRVVVLDPGAVGMDLSTGLSRIMAGPLFQTAIDRDGSVQPSYGPVQHGAAARSRQRRAFDNYDTIAAPS